MTDSRDLGVRNGAHCEWQIRKHIVLPMTYCKASLNEEVTIIIRETGVEIEARFLIKREVLVSEGRDAGKAS